MTIPILPGTPPELVVYDKPGRCPYLPDRLARMPLRLPVRALSRDEMETRLGAGDRRQGYVLYRTRCPECCACEPIRLHVDRFAPNRSQKRAFRRGQKLLRVEMGAPRIDESRVALYNLHKKVRGLGDGQPAIDADGYRDFLVSTCCESFELAYYIGHELVAVAIVDRGVDSLSAVYCYYDPARERLGPGTYSIMKQVELCKRWGLRYLYLGLYIADCDAMRYKARYLPHERMIGGQWIEFGASADDRESAPPASLPQSLKG